MNSRLLVVKNRVNRKMIASHAKVKLLSIVLQGKNDSYMGNFLWRLSTCINKHARNTFELGAESDVEIVLIDWGSESPLALAIDLDEHAKQLLRVVYAPPTVALKYNQDSPYSWVHALNCAVRRSIGEFILISDSDGYLPLESMRKILVSLRENQLGECSFDRSFFVGSRFHIPKEFHSQGPSISEIDEFIREQGSVLEHDKVDIQFFAGNAATYLWTRKIWDECRGFDERFIYWGWYDTDLFLRLSARYQAADLEEFGIRTYHLEHYSNRESRRTKSELSRRINRGLPPKEFAHNGVLWGLGGETLSITHWIAPRGAPSERSSLVPEKSDEVYFRLVEVARLLNVIRLMISRYGQRNVHLREPLNLVIQSRDSILDLMRHWFQLKLKLLDAETEKRVQTVLAEADRLILELSLQNWFKELWEKRDQRDEPFA